MLAWAYIHACGNLVIFPECGGKVSGGNTNKTGTSLTWQVRYATHAKVQYPVLVIYNFMEVVGTNDTRKDSLKWWCPIFTLSLWVCHSSRQPSLRTGTGRGMMRPRPLLVS